MEETEDRTPNPEDSSGDSPPATAGGEIPNVFADDDDDFATSDYEEGGGDEEEVVRVAPVSGGEGQSAADLAPSPHVNLDDPTAVPAGAEAANARVDAEAERVGRQSRQYTGVFDKQKAHERGGPARGGNIDPETQRSLQEKISGLVGGEEDPSQRAPGNGAGGPARVAESMEVPEQQAVSPPPPPPAAPTAAPIDNDDDEDDFGSADVLGTAWKDPGQEAGEAPAAAATGGQAPDARPAAAAAAPEAAPAENKPPPLSVWASSFSAA